MSRPNINPTNLLEKSAHRNGRIKDIAEFDVGAAFEATIRGIVRIISRFFITIWYLTFRPFRTVELVADRDQSVLSHPLTFLCIATLLLSLSSAYSIDAGSFASLDYATMLGPIADTRFAGQLYQQVGSLNLMSFVLYTAPTAGVVIALAAAAARLLGDQRGSFQSPLVSTLCLVIGYRLVLRTAISFADVAVAVLYLDIGVTNYEPTTLPELLLFLTVMIPLLLLAIYSVLFAGWPQAWIALSRFGGRFYRRSWLGTAVVSGMCASAIYLTGLMSPIVVKTVMHAKANSISSRISPEAPERKTLELRPLHRLKFSAVDSSRLHVTASLIVNNLSGQDIVIDPPQFVEIPSLEARVRCHSAIDQSLGIGIINRGAVRLLTIDTMLDANQSQKLVRDGYVNVAIDIFAADGSSLPELATRIFMDQSEVEQITNWAVDSNRIRAAQEFPPAAGAILQR